MKFRYLPETILGSKAKLKVLLYLLSENVASERDIARRIGISHTAVNKIMKEFCEVNLLTQLKIGNVNAWVLNKESYAFDTIKSLERLAKVPPLTELKSEFDALYPYSDVRKIIIYGSVAEGKEMADSDVDVFILIKDESTRKSVVGSLLKLSERFRKKYGNNLSILVKTVKEREKMNKNLVRNIEKGIVIQG